MTPQVFYQTILIPAQAFIRTVLPELTWTRPALVELMAIAGHESNWTDVAQKDGGEGRGPFQFETVAISDMLRHPLIGPMVRAFVRSLGCPITATGIWEDLLGNPNAETLAVGLARLLLWSDPYPVPVNAAEGWTVYDRVWRPGDPHPETWPDTYAEADAAVPLDAGEIA